MTQTDTILKGQLKGVFRKHKQLLPLFLILASCLQAIIASINGTVVMAGETYDFALSSEHYAAFGILLVNFVCYFFLRQFYKYVLAVTVIVGLSNLANFSDLETTQCIKVNSLKVCFQPATFWAAVLAYLINFKRVNSAIVSIFMSERTPEEIDQNMKARFDEEMQTFKERYAHYPSERLNELVLGNKLVPAALAAAQVILNERQTDETVS